MKNFSVKILAVLILLLLGLSVKSQTNELEGIWALSDIELYKHTGNDSIQINSSQILPHNMRVVIDTLSFFDDKCKAKINNDPMESLYAKKNNTLELYFFPTPFVYEIIHIDDKYMELYYKYPDVSLDNINNTIFYKIRLKYSK